MPNRRKPGLEVFQFGMNNFIAIGLMLIVSTPSAIALFSIGLHHTFLHHKRLNDTVQDQYISTCTKALCDSTTAQLPLPCDETNGTIFINNNSTWTLLCDIDFFAQDIFPFILARSFGGCMQYCDNYNTERGHGACAGFVYAPTRSNLDNDCYLKSSLNDSVFPATLHLIGASLHPETVTSNVIATNMPATPLLPITTLTIESIVTPPKLDSRPTSVSPQQNRIPSVNKSTFLGTSVDEVASQYISHTPAKSQLLAAAVLEPGVNIDLITSYPLASDTGTWTSYELSTYQPANMTVRPRISRDGGRGGKVDGTNIFIFCDTSTYGEVKDPTLGYLNGFVSSSIAVDESMNALSGNALNLINSLGQWQDDVGRMRGWVPMTTGEEAFNVAISGKGYRYAVWPNSSPISLNQTHAIIYAPLVYVQVDMQDQSSPGYTSLGNTLLLVSIDPVYGPHADRLHNQFFTQDEVSWGSLGGIRAWTSTGQDMIDGEIYLFGQAGEGVVVSKVSANDFTDRDKYVYWNGQAWSNEMLPKDSSSNAYMINQPVMSMDLIYSPFHRTFIMIYLTPDADNTFYYRYLKGKNNSTLNVITPYEQGGDNNYVENILTNAWSDAQILFEIPTPERGYVYAGGVHAGYFNKDDITMGGTKMLCTWTEHTKVDPEKPDSGYAHMAQVIDLGWDTQ